MTLSQKKSNHRGTIAWRRNDRSDRKIRIIHNGEASSRDG